LTCVDSGNSKDGRQYANYRKSAIADGKPSVRVARRRIGSFFARFCTDKSALPSGEPAVSPRDLISFRSNHAVTSFHCLNERSMSSGGSSQPVRQSSLAVVRQHDYTTPNRDSRPSVRGPHGSGSTGNLSSRPGSDLSATAPRSAQLSPNTRLMRAWRSLIELHIDDALASVAQFEDEIARADAPVAPRSREFAELLRAVLLVLQSHDGAAVRAALTVLESRHRSGRKSAALAVALRIGYWKVRDFDRYYAVPRLDLAVPTHRGTHACATIIGQTFEAIVEAEQLRLAVATRLARSAHERAVNRFGKRSPVTARAAVVLAELLYEEGHHAGLDALVMESLAAVRNSGDEESALRGYRVLARLAARRGDTEFAFLILNEAEVLAAARNSTVMMAESLILRTQLLLKEGRAHEAAICAERIEAIAHDFSSDDTLRASHALACAQVLIATGDARRGATILRELQAATCGKRNNYWALRLSVQLADALLECGDLVEGRAMLVQALQVGARAGVYQTFLDAGAHVAEFLSSLQHATPQDSRLPPELRPYIGSILADRAQLRARTMPTRPLRVTESLSPREHSVLRSMSCGLSNKRIAQELQIAPETVKSHVKGIFVKLAVQTRAHAVSIAGALGLL
jgi:LuxR family transcriptional regulator, maltose regulon positive regulatory protein